MAESTLGVSLTELRSAVCRALSFNRTYASLTADQAADVDEVVARGLRRFYAPMPLNPGDPAHQWSFLRPTTTITTQAPYSTGTVTITNGVALLTGGTWPSWADTGVLMVNGGVYTVALRNSNTVITLDEISVQASSGTAYTLALSDQDMPDLFGGIEGTLTYPETTGKQDIIVVSENDIRRMRSEQGWTVGAPRFAALRPLTTGGSTGQRFQILWHPAPDDDYILSYKYIALLNNLAAGQYPPGGMLHAETIISSCLAVAEEWLGQGTRTHRDRFAERLAASISIDSRAMAPASLGFNLDHSDGGVVVRNNASQFVTYRGTLYT